MQIKKEKQTKNKPSSKEVVGRMQKNNTKEVWECVLYLRGKRAYLLKLAHRASLTKGFSWSISKIRPENTATTMLQLQYKFGRKWSDFYREYEKVGGKRICGQDFIRQIDNHKGIRLVRIIIRKI